VEITDTRERVEKARVEAIRQVQSVEDAFSKRYNAVDESIHGVQKVTEEHGVTIESLTQATNDNFERVRDDAVKSKLQINDLKREVGDVDDKIAINNVVTMGVETVAGCLEVEKREADELAMKKFFSDYVRESEAKLVEKEKAREKEMEMQLMERMQRMESEYQKKMVSGSTAQEKSRRKRQKR